MKNYKKITNYSIIAVLSISIFIMSSSFVTRVFINKPVDPNIELTKKTTNAEVIQVNILNATEQKGLAKKAKDYLKARGFDVVEIGNYSSNLEKSQIVDRMGDMNSAKKVAQVVGIKDSLVVSAIDSNMFLRTSIIIGNDFTELKPFHN